MFAGHFGVAAAVKAKQPGVPLWSLMAATQLLDILFVPLYVSGIETIDSSGGSGYGKAVIHADYTHSLAGALLIALIAGFASAKLWGRRGGVTIAAVTLSHWLLDWLVHHADLPILPGNAGGLPLLGLGLWSSARASAGIEFLLIAAGFWMYVRSLGDRADGRRIFTKIGAASVMGVLLFLSLVADVFGWG